MAKSIYYISNNGKSNLENNSETNTSHITCLTKTTNVTAYITDNITLTGNHTFNNITFIGKFQNNRPYIQSVSNFDTKYEFNNCTLSNITIARLYNKQTIPLVFTGKSNITNCLCMYIYGVNYGIDFSGSTEMTICSTTTNYVLGWYAEKHSKDNQTTIESITSITDLRLPPWEYCIGNSYNRGLKSNNDGSIDDSKHIDINESYFNCNGDITHFENYGADCINANGRFVNHNELFFWSDQYGYNFGVYKGIKFRSSENQIFPIKLCKDSVFYSKDAYIDFTLTGHISSNDVKYSNNLYVSLHGWGENGYIDKSSALTHVLTNNTTKKTITYFTNLSSCIHNGLLTGDSGKYCNQQSYVYDKENGYNNRRPLTDIYEIKNTNTTHMSTITSAIDTYNESANSKIFYGTLTDGVSSYVYTYPTDVNFFCKNLSIGGNSVSLFSQVSGDILEINGEKYDNIIDYLKRTPDILGCNICVDTSLAISNYYSDDKLLFKYQLENSNLLTNNETLNSTLSDIDYGDVVFIHNKGNTEFKRNHTDNKDEGFWYILENQNDGLDVKDAAKQMNHWKCYSYPLGYITYPFYLHPALSNSNCDFSPRSFKFRSFITEGNYYYPQVLTQQSFENNYKEINYSPLCGNAWVIDSGYMYNTLNYDLVVDKTIEFYDVACHGVYCQGYGVYGNNINKHISIKDNITCHDNDEKGEHNYGVVQYGGFTSSNIAFSDCNNVWINGIASLKHIRIVNTHYTETKDNKTKITWPSITFLVDCGKCCCRNFGVGLSTNIPWALPDYSWSGMLFTSDIVPSQLYIRGTLNESAEEYSFLSDYTYDLNSVKYYPDKSETKPIGIKFKNYNKNENTKYDFYDCIFALNGSIPSITFNKSLKLDYTKYNIFAFKPGDINITFKPDINTNKHTADTINNEIGYNVNLDDIVRIIFYPYFSNITVEQYNKKLQKYILVNSNLATNLYDNIFNNIKNVIIGDENALDVSSNNYYGLVDNFQFKYTDIIETNLVSALSAYYK